MIFLEIEYLLKFVKSQYKEDSKKINENIEIILYNLYHLLSKIKLEYSRDSYYNKKLSILRQISKSLDKFIKLNREVYISTNERKKIIDDIFQLIFLF